MEDQNRHSDRGQDIANIDLHRHPVDGERGAWAGGAAQRLAEPVEQGFVIREVGPGLGELLLEVLLGPPTLLDLVELTLPLGLGFPDRIVGRGRAARIRAPEHDGSDALGIRRREERGHRSRVPGGDQGRASRASRVHDRSDVVHSRFQRGHVSRPVGETDAPPVEANQAAERGEPLEEARNGGVLQRVRQV